MARTTDVGEHILEICTVEELRLALLAIRPRLADRIAAEILEGLSDFADLLWGWVDDVTDAAIEARVVVEDELLAERSLRAVWASVGDAVLVLACGDLDLGATEALGGDDTPCDPLDAAPPERRAMRPGRGSVRR